MSNEQQGRRRCPDDGVCHGSTIAVGSEPCAPGECYRVRVAGPLSGVYPGDRWPDEVRAANGAEPRPRAVRELFREAAEQEAVSGEAAAVLVGPVKDGRHGEVQAELRRIQVAVRGQMDGIRPIEAVVLTYRWTPPTEWAGGMEPACWTFEGMETLVQGLDGSLKPGTPLSADEWAQLGPSLGWVWDLVHAMRPRG